MKDKLSNISQVTSVVGFALSIIVALVCGVLYVKDTFAFHERRIAILENNQVNFYATIAKLSTDSDRLKDSVEKIYIIVSSNNKNAVIP